MEWWESRLGVTIKSGALVRPLLALLSLLDMRLYKRHTHNGIIRDTAGDRYSTYPMLQGSRYLAMLASPARPRLVSTSWQSWTMIASILLRSALSVRRVAHRLRVAIGKVEEHRGRTRMALSSKARQRRW